MRIAGACLVLLAAMTFIVISPVAAQFNVGLMGGPVNIGIPYVAGPGFTYAAPFSQGGVFMQAFNTSMLAHDYTGSLAIAFSPAETDGFGFPAFAGPTIAQTTSDSIVASQSYFFNDIVVV